MRWIPIAALIAIAVLALPAVAQVHRCKDASGKMTYTDAPCGAGQSGGLLERQRAQGAIYQERLQAAEAEDRKQRQRITAQEREWDAQTQRAPQHQSTPPTRHSGDDWASRKALQNAQTGASSISHDGGRWDQAAEERRNAALGKAISSPPPSGFTNCDGGFCHDNQGGTYHRVSPDYMTGPNGRACHRAGDMWNCS